MCSGKENIFEFCKEFISRRLEEHTLGLLQPISVKMSLVTFGPFEDQSGFENQFNESTFCVFLEFPNVLEKRYLLKTTVKQSSQISLSFSLEYADIDYVNCNLTQAPEWKILNSSSLDIDFTDEFKRDLEEYLQKILTLALAQIASEIS